MSDFYCGTVDVNSGQQVLDMSIHAHAGLALREQIENYLGSCRDKRCNIEFCMDYVGPKKVPALMCSGNTLIGTNAKDGRSMLARGPTMEQAIKTKDTHHMHGMGIKTCVASLGDYDTKTRASCIYIAWDSRSDRGLVGRSGHELDTELADGKKMCELWLPLEYDAESNRPKISRGPGKGEISNMIQDGPFSDGRNDDVNERNLMNAVCECRRRAFEFAKRNAPGTSDFLGVCSQFIIFNMGTVARPGCEWKDGEPTVRDTVLRIHPDSNELEYYDYHEDPSKCKFKNLLDFWGNAYINQSHFRDGLKDGPHYFGAISDRREYTVTVLTPNSAWREGMPRSLQSAKYIKKTLADAQNRSITAKIIRCATENKCRTPTTSGEEPTAYICVNRVSEADFPITERKENKKARAIYVNSANKFLSSATGNKTGTCTPMGASGVVIDYGGHNVLCLSPDTFHLNGSLGEPMSTVSASTFLNCITANVSAHKIARALFAKMVTGLSNDKMAIDEMELLNDKPIKECGFKGKTGLAREGLDGDSRAKTQQLSFGTAGFLPQEKFQAKYGPLTGVDDFGERVNYDRALEAGVARNCIYALSLLNLAVYVRIPAEKYRLTPCKLMFRAPTKVERDAGILGPEYLKKIIYSAMAGYNFSHPSVQDQQRFTFAENIYIGTKERELAEQQTRRAQEEQDKYAEIEARAAARFEKATLEAQEKARDASQEAESARKEALLLNKKAEAERREKEIAQCNLEMQQRASERQNVEYTRIIDEEVKKGNAATKAAAHAESELQAFKEDQAKKVLENETKRGTRSKRKQNSESTLSEEAVQHHDAFPQHWFYEESEGVTEIQKAKRKKLGAVRSCTYGPFGPRITAIHAQPMRSFLSAHMIGIAKAISRSADFYALPINAESGQKKGLIEIPGIVTVDWIPELPKGKCPEYDRLFDLHISLINNAMGNVEGMKRTIAFHGDKDPAFGGAVADAEPASSTTPLLCATKATEVEDSDSE
tara:strand:- start:1317 stop:4313 length:2997 start_codon:yes stop_codon:yes gene_type:complete